MATLEEILADEVKKRPFLYDKSHPMYNNRLAIDNGWIQIASAIANLFDSPMDCMYTSLIFLTIIKECFFQVMK